MSKIVRPITMDLSITDTLLIIDGLTYIAKDMERHELDQELARRLIDRVKVEVDNNAVEIERGD